MWHCNLEAGNVTAGITEQYCVVALLLLVGNGTDGITVQYSNVSLLLRSWECI